MTTRSSGSESRNGRNFRSARRWWRQWSSAASSRRRSATSSGAAAHSSAKKRSCVSSPAAFSPRRATSAPACGVGHVGREDEVGVGQRPDDRGLDPLVLGNRLGEARRIEPGDLPVVPLTEGGGVDLGLPDDLVDARIADPLEEIRQVPRDLFRPGDLGRCHPRESSCRRGADAPDGTGPSCAQVAAAASPRAHAAPVPSQTPTHPRGSEGSAQIVTSPCRVRANCVARARLRSTARRPDETSTGGISRSAHPGASPARGR